MSQDKILGKAYTLLQEYADFSGSDDEFMAKVAELEKEFRQNCEEIHSPQSIQTRILSGHCGENFSLYTGMFIFHGTAMIDHAYCGKTSLHTALLKQIGAESSDSIDIIDDDEKITSSLCSIEEGNFRFIFAAYSSSPFFSADFFNNFSRKSASIFSSFFITSYDFYEDSNHLARWMNESDEELYLLCYRFHNFFPIFNHLGMSHIEKIQDYIQKRLSEKYPAASLIYQFSFEVFLVFVPQGTEDKRIEFTTNEIPIPYTCRKVIVKGKEKYTRLREFIYEKV